MLQTLAILALIGGLFAPVRVAAKECYVSQFNYYADSACTSKGGSSPGVVSNDLGIFGFAGTMNGAIDSKECKKITKNYKTIGYMKVECDGETKAKLTKYTDALCTQGATSYTFENNKCVQA